MHLYTFPWVFGTIAGRWFSLTTAGSRKHLALAAGDATGATVAYHLAADVLQLQHLK